MKLKQFDAYHRRKIYGTKINLSYAKTSEEKKRLTRILRAHIRSAKQIQRT